MVVGIRDAVKLFGISVIVFCAVFVCTLFLNYRLDLLAIEDTLASAGDLLLFEAQVSTAEVVCLVSGGCLMATSAVMMIFYIRHYVDTHKKELGILKATGYSEWKIAGNFWVFGLNVGLGAAAGFGSAFLFMPYMYGAKSGEPVFFMLSIGFHPGLLFWMVLAPTALFTVLAVLYARRKLGCPALALLREQADTSGKIRKIKKAAKIGKAAKIEKTEKNGKAERNRKYPAKEGSFLEELRRNTLREKKVLVFFVVFASFCFSAMTQMSFAMDELSSVLMGVTVLLIGMVLACTTLFLAIVTVIKGNTKTIAMMQAFGYSRKECVRALLGGYRPIGYLGFAIGSIYQYALLKIMVSVVFADVAGAPDYKFDIPALLISLTAFAVIYELVMYWYAGKIQKISVKEIMSEG